MHRCIADVPTCRRADAAGGTYFFTVNLAERRSTDADDVNFGE